MKNNRLFDYRRVSMTLDFDLDERHLTMQRLYMRVVNERVMRFVRE